MGELFFSTSSSFYSSYPNFHNQMGKSNGEMCSWIPMFYDQDVPSCPQHGPTLDHFQDEAETFPGIGEQILPLFQYKYHSTIPPRPLSPRPSNETIITDVTMGQPALTRPPETTTNPIHSGEGEGGATWPLLHSVGGTKEKQTVPPSVDLVFFDFCHFGPCDVQEPESIYISSRRGWMSPSYKVLSFSALRSPLLLIRSLRPGDRVST